MTERVRRLLEYHFAENNDTGITKRTVARNSCQNSKESS